MTPGSTPTQQLVDLQLGGHLEEFVRGRRADGRPWRLIERDLWTEHGIAVTYETLRRWFPDEAEESRRLAVADASP